MPVIIDFILPSARELLGKSEINLKATKYALLLKAALQIKEGFVCVPILGGDICWRYRDLCS